MVNFMRLVIIIFFLTGCATSGRGCYDRLKKKKFPSEISISRELLFETSNMDDVIEGLRVDVGCSFPFGEEQGVPIYYGFNNERFFVAFAKTINRRILGEEVEGVSVLLYLYKSDGSFVYFGEISSYFRFEGYGVIVDSTFDDEGIQLCQREVEHYSYFKNGDVDRELDTPIFHDCKKTRIDF